MLLVLQYASLEFGVMLLVLQQCQSVCLSGSIFGGYVFQVIMLPCQLSLILVGAGTPYIRGSY